MSLLDTEIIDILITAHDEAQAAFAEASAEADATSGHFTMMAHGIGLGMVAVGAAAAGVLALSAKAAIDFQSMTTKVMNNTTMGAAGMATMRTAILNMSAASGAPLDQLANGFMHIQNLGYSTADSITILQQAMESAVSTGSNTGDVANALALQMHDFGLNATQAARAMDVMHLAAAEGNATLEQYVDSTSKAVSTAANLGLSMTDTDAALSALSRHMNISQASTMLAGMLQKISGPSVGAQKELAALSKTSGIDLVADFSAAGLKARGLTGVLADLEAATHGNYTEIQKLIPATRGGMAALVLNGTASKDYQDILKSLNATMAGQSTPTIQAYAAYLSTAAGTQARLSAGLNVMAIEIGTAVLPALQSLLTAALPIVQAVTNWVGKHAQLTARILEGVAAVGLLTGAIMVLTPVVSAVGAVLGVVSAPLVAIVAAGALLYEAWQHDWGGIREITASVWATVKPVFDAMGNAVSTLRAAFNAGGIGAVFGDVPGALGGVGSAVGSVAGTIAGQFAGAFSQINWPDVEEAAIHGLNDVFNTLTSWLQQTGIPFFTGRLGDLKSAFQSIDWKGIGSGILSALGTLKDDILAIDWKGIGKNILGALNTLWSDIKAINWSQVGSDVLGALSSLKNAIQGIDWKGLGNAALSALDGLRSAIQGVDWAGLWKTLKASFTGVVSWIGSLDWSGWASDAIAGVRTGLGILGSWIGTAAPIVGGYLTTWGAEFGSWVMDSGWPALKIALGTILGSLGTWIDNQAGSLGTDFGKWASEFGAWVMAKGWPALQTGLTKLGEAFGNWIVLISPPSIAAHMTVWTAKFTGWVLTDALPDLLSDAKTLLGKFTDWIKGGGAGSILTAAKTWPTKILAAWVAPGIFLLQVGKDLISGMIQGMTDQAKSLQAYVASITTSVLKWLGDTSQVLLADGKAVLHGLMDGMKQIAPELTKYLKGLGADIINGITDGIKSVGGGISGFIVGHLNDATNAARAAVGAHSPSQVYHDLGVNIVDGLINGLNYRHTALVQAFDRMMSVVNAPTSSNTASIGGGVALGLGAGTVNQSFTIQVTVNTGSGHISTTGDASGVGKIVGDMIRDGFQSLRNASRTSNSVSGRLSLGGAV